MKAALVCPERGEALCCVVPGWAPQRPCKECEGWSMVATV